MIFISKWIKLLINFLGIILNPFSEGIQDFPAFDAMLLSEGEISSQCLFDLSGLI